jgi:hypothetical protein
MLVFFRNGDPNISVKMIEMKETNPRPMNSGDPHLQDREWWVGMLIEADAQPRLRGGDIRTQLEESCFWTTAATV